LIYSFCDGFCFKGHSLYNIPTLSAFESIFCIEVCMRKDLGKVSATDWCNWLRDFQEAAAVRMAIGPISLMPRLRITVCETKPLSFPIAPTDQLLKRQLSRVIPL